MPSPPGTSLLQAQQIRRTTSRELPFLATLSAEDVFSSPAKAAAIDHEALQAQLFEQIGRLKMELEWMKKKVAPVG